MILADLLRRIEEWIPQALAAEWDNVGLLLGDPSSNIDKAMTCLTVTPESAKEAIERGAGLIVSHHPILFRPVKKLTTANAEGRMLLDLARADVAVYSPHTAFDNAPGGINDGIARRLGLTAVRPLRPIAAGKNVKLAIFVPESDLAKVSDAIFAAGAGVIGQYSQCGFRLAGTGTFFGSDASQPVVGQKGRREEVAEWRLEAICPESKLEAVTRALRSAHSYEEPAFDIYPLAPDPSRYGQGRVGTLPTATTLEAFAALVKSVLRADAVQIVGDGKRPVSKVALACGAAGEFLGDAGRNRADVFLTGEIRFHDALDAQSRDIALVAPGHYATERPGVEDLAERLAAEFPALTIWPSAAETDPFKSC